MLNEMSSREEQLPQRECVALTDTLPYVKP